MTSQTPEEIPNIEEEKGMELILEVLPHLILGNAEELYNNPDGEMAKNTISEMQRVIRETHHQQLQKARAEEKERAIEIIKDELRTAPLEVQMTKGIVFANIIGRIHSELDQPTV